MGLRSFIILAASFFLAIPARAEDTARPLPAAADVIYKGLVGKALDAVPMDPDERVELQRASAVVSGTLTGRSLAAWAGLSNPILLIAGLAWGLYSALNIEAAPGERQDTERTRPREPVQTQVAALSGPTAAEAAEAAR